MSQILTTAATTTPPVTVVSSGLSSMSSVTVAPSLTGFPVSLDQHGMAFGFRASTPPDNISLNSANRKVDQSLSDFQTGLGATAYATLDTE